MRLVIFDCDGTLVDSRKIIVAAMTMTFEAVGLEAPDRTSILGLVGLSLRETFRHLLDLRPGQDEHALEHLIAAYRQSFSELREDPAMAEPLYEGAREALDALAREDRLLLGIATGKSRTGVRRLLERESLGGYFSVIQTADDAPSKPDPGMIEQALEATGVGARDAVMIGDTTFDMLMARNAGVRALGVAWGYHPVDELHQTGATRVLRAYDELGGALEHVWGPQKRSAR